MNKNTYIQGLTNAISRCPIRHTTTKFRILVLFLWPGLSTNQIASSTDMTSPVKRPLVWRARDEGLLCLGLTWWFERSGLRYRSVIKCSTLIVDTKARYRVHKCVINCCIIELNWSVHEQKWWTNCVIPFRSHLFNFHSLFFFHKPPLVWLV